MTLPPRSPSSLPEPPAPAASRTIAVLVGICAAVAIVASLSIASSVFEPLVFALFVIALVWPLQEGLQARMPKLLALAITLSVTILVILLLTGMIGWGFGRVGRWFIAESARLQLIYARNVEWLEQHGIVVSGIIAEHFNVGMMIRVFQDLTSRINTMLSFAVVTMVLVMLGLLETDDARMRLKRLPDHAAGEALLRAAAETGRRFRRYMMVRTWMSLMTGVLVWAFARLTGLELAAEWGVIAFVLNYIPFIGPFIATLLPTVLATAQFESWQMALVVFACLNLIQFLVGSYLEPRIAGSALSLSPFVVLLAVFFFSFLWGLAGAFIGVPIVIAALAVCEQFPASRWVAELMASGAPEAEA
jgi:predicted PurR-regulated permease PerM